MKRNNNTNRILGGYRRAVAHLRNRSRCVCNDASAMRATTQGEEASEAAPSSCDGESARARGIQTAADLAAWGRIGQRPRGA